MTTNWRTKLIRPILVRPLSNHRIYLEFYDGSKGTVDLSDLARTRLFESWNDYAFFEKVRIGDHREIKWNDEIQPCADSLYLRLTGKTVDELYPRIEPFS